VLQKFLVQVEHVSHTLYACAIQADAAGALVAGAGIHQGVGGGQHHGHAFAADAFCHDHGCAVDDAELVQVGQGAFAGADAL
jgi:hypothetical protein